MNLTAGAILQSGRYVIQSTLQQTELSVRYLATHAGLNQTVILQTLNPAIATHNDFPQLERQFQSEIKILARCRHPHLLRMLDRFEENGASYVVLDCVPGRILANVVQPGQPLSESEAVRYIHQAAGALQALHKQGLLHRDIKPQNLILANGGQDIVLVGYGFVYEMRSRFVSSDAASAQQPSVFYSAQEPFTPGADIRALSVTFYYLLAGQYPSADLLQGAGLEQQSLPQIRQLHPHLNSQIEQAILQGLRPLPLRPQAVDDWLAILDGIHTASTVLDSPTSSPPIQDPVQAPLSVVAATHGHTVEPEWSTPASTLSTPSSSPTAAATIPVLPRLPVDEHLMQAVAAKTAIATPTSTSEPSDVSRMPSSKHWLPIALLMTSVVAGMAGAGLGLAFRLDGSSDSIAIPGAPKVGSEQAFPPLENWPEPEDYDYTIPRNIPVERRRPAQNAPTEFSAEELPPPSTPDLYSPDPVEEEAVDASGDPVDIDKGVPDTSTAPDLTDISPLPTDPVDLVSPPVSTPDPLPPTSSAPPADTGSVPSPDVPPVAAPPKTLPEVVPTVPEPQ